MKKTYEEIVALIEQDGRVGKVPDRVVAKQVRCSISFVCRYRQSIGLRSFQEFRSDAVRAIMLYTPRCRGKILMLATLLKISKQAASAMVKRVMDRERIRK